MRKIKSKPILAVILSLVLFLSGCGGKIDKGAETKENTSGSGPGAVAAAPQGNEIRDRYTIDLTLDTEQKSITGKVKIEVNNTSGDEWDQLGLRDYIPAIYKTLEEMLGERPAGTSELIRIKNLDTGKELSHTRDEEDVSMVYANLDNPLVPGGKMQIEIEFQADIPDDSIRFRWSEPEEGKLLFELSQFYPVLAIYENGAWQHDPFIFDGECFYSKAADYIVNLTVPDGYTVIASGHEEKTGTKNGMNTWKVIAENMRDVAVTVSNCLKKMSGTVDGVEVNSYYFDNADAEEQGQIMLQTGLESMGFFSRLFGKYPYESLDIVMTNDYLTGIEYPAYVRVTDYTGMAGESGSDADLAVNVQDTTSHEVAHQWFYAAVGNNSYREAWLDESFASFGALLYLGEFGSEEEMKELVDQNRKDADYYKGTFLNDSYEELGQMYTSSVYFRGQVFLYDLMQLMGEKAFYDMMQDYYSTFGLKEAHTQDFVDMVYRHDDSREVKSLMEEYLRLD